MQEFDRIAQRVRGPGWRQACHADGRHPPGAGHQLRSTSGIDPESIGVTVDRGVLTVSAKRGRTTPRGEAV